jgi:hypothetical protein
MRKVSGVWKYLSFLSVWMIRVTNPKEAPATLRSLEEHAISAWVWRAIGDTMLYYVNVDSGTKRFVKALATSSINNFLDREIASLGMFAVKECGGYPNFIGNFEAGKNIFFHNYLHAM